MFYPEAISGQALEQALATDSHGPTQCLVGFELDYSLEEYSLDDCSPAVHEEFSEAVIARRAAFEDATRRQAHRQISDLRPQNDEEAERKADWLGQVDALTRPELVMFMAHSILAQPTLSPGRGDLQKAFSDTGTHNTLEYRFGKGRYQAGYYDNEPEIRTMPAPPEAALKRRQQAIATYRMLAAQHGMQVKFGSDDTNISFWQEASDGRHELVHGLETKEQALFSRHVGEVMLLALRDANPVIVPYSVLAQNTSLVWSLGNYRSTSMRVTPDRFEHRIGRGEVEDASQRLAALIGGFISARQHPSSRSRIARLPAFGPSETYDKGRDIHVLRAVEHSEIDAAGYLRLDTAYASVRASQILSALVGYRHSKVDPYLDSRTTGLVKTIRYQDERLECDPQALASWRRGIGEQDLRQLENVGQAQLDADYINSRLQTVAYAGLRYAIEGYIGDDLSRADKFAEGLQRYIDSPLFDMIVSREDRQKIATQRMDWFVAHEQTL